MAIDVILDRVLMREKGYKHHPDDEGGPTNWGITAATLGQWRKLGRSATADEVRSLSRDEALQILRRRYVLDPGLDMLHNSLVLDGAVDTAILFGVARAVGWLTVAPDLIDRIDSIPMSAPDAVQDLLLAAVNPPLLKRLSLDDAARINLTSSDRIVDVLSAMRCLRHAKRVKDAPDQMVFLRGWLARALAFTVR